jgi:hypothetical protein
MARKSPCTANEQYNWLMCRPAVDRTLRNPSLFPERMLHSSVMRNVTHVVKRNPYTGVTTTRHILYLHEGPPFCHKAKYAMHVYGGIFAIRITPTGKDVVSTPRSFWCHIFRAELSDVASPIHRLKFDLVFIT